MTNTLDQNNRSFIEIHRFLRDNSFSAVSNKKVMCTLWTRDSSALNADLVGNDILPSDSDQSAFFNNSYIHSIIF